MNNITRLVVAIKPPRFALLFKVWFIYQFNILVIKFKLFQLKISNFDSLPNIYMNKESVGLRSRLGFL